MTSKPTYNIWWSLLIGGLCSAFIQPSAFYGSFIDCLIAIPLGMILVLVQVAVSKNDLYSSLFEFVVSLSFLHFLRLDSDRSFFLPPESSLPPSTLSSLLLLLPPVNSASLPSLRDRSC